MAATRPPQTDRSADRASDPVNAWSTAFVESGLRLQRLQWDSLVAWQNSLATFNKDFREQWACRYAGGIPIDA